MGEIIHLKDYLRKKEQSEEEQFSEDIIRVQKDLKKLLEDLDDPDIQRQYEEGYDEIMKAFKKVDCALDDYIDAFHILVNVTGTMPQDDNHYYSTTTIPEEEE